jgi:hypothetical protein
MYKDEFPDEWFGIYYFDGPVRVYSYWKWVLDDDTLDFLGLASPPLDDLNVFNRIMGDLLDDGIDVYLRKISNM